MDAIHSKLSFRKRLPRQSFLPSKKSLFKTSHGFTIIELLMVIALIGIFAVVTAPKLGNVSNTRADIALHKIQSDVRYAQQFAMQTQKRTQVNFSATANAYFLYYETTPNNFQLMKHPLTKGNYSQSLGSGEYDGVTLTVSGTDPVFGPNQHVILFNEYGAPHWHSAFAAAAVPMTEPSYVRLNTNYQLDFHSETGQTTIS